MKLMIAIVNNDDSAVVSSALTRENYTVTKLSTTGGFLMVGNTTFLIGTEEDRVPRAKEIIKEYSKTRTHDAASTASFGKGLADGDLGAKVNVGGAMVFVLSVDEAEKY